MGRKRGGGGSNKSQAIREYIAANPGAGPNAVAAALQEKGIKVSAAYVSTVKAADKRKGLGGFVKSGVAWEDLVQGKNFVDRVGGIDQAFSILHALKKLAE